MLHLDDDDDEDFTIKSGKSSKLANLFVSNEMPEDLSGSNKSLIYTPPKQPKKIEITSNAKSGVTNVMTLIHASAVNVFKFENGKYSSQGKLGSALLGNHDSCIYKLILYTGKQQHITYASINENFKFICQPNNYSSFYDDNRQNWSIMFDNEEEKCAFSKLLLVCKYNVSEKSGNDSSILVQDLMLGNENSQIVAEDNDTIEVKYNGWLFDDKNSVGKLFVNHESMTKKPFRIKLESEWTQVFRGLKTGGKRYVIIPFKMREKFSEIIENAPIEQVLRYGFEFQLIKIRPRKVSQSEKQIDGNEQTISDSNETDKQQISDTTTRLRTLSASVKDESQPNKSKSDILSRVARMGGLPILPIKIESNTKSESINATDAHNNEEEIIQMKPLPKPRNNSIQSVNNLQIDTSVTDSNDKIPDSKTNSNQIPTNVPQIPVTNSYQIPSYFMTQNTSIDSNLSLLTNETRINNSEVRMTLTKIIDKIDLVSEKISDIKNNANSSIPSIPVSSIGFMDSTILLSSIQKIVNDNNNLKKELEDKTVRLQTLNEKICDLLQQQSINTKSYNPSEEIERLLTNESRLKRELNVLREDCERYKANNQDLNLENAQLKNKIHELKSQIQTNSVNRVDEELNITQTKEFTSQVKKIMNDVFRKFMSQIDENKTYPTEEIVQIVTNSIRSVTFALIESRSNSERNSPSHQSFDEIDVNKINYEKSKNVFNTNVLESNFKKELKKPPIPERKIIETQQKTNEDNDSDQFKDDSIKDSDLDNYVETNNVVSVDNNVDSAQDLSENNSVFDQKSKV